MKTVQEVHAALDECRHHAAILREALSDLGPVRFAADSVEQISGETRRLLDQMAYRFGKLQDTLGLRVLPGMLDLSEEPLAETKPFGEKLQRLERLGVIPSVEDWRTLRELRNPLAHEYVDAPTLKAAALNRFIGGVETILAIRRHVARYAEGRGWDSAE